MYNFNNLELKKIIYENIIKKMRGKIKNKIMSERERYYWIAILKKISYLIQDIVYNIGLI